MRLQLLLSTIFCFWGSLAPALAHDDVDPESSLLIFAVTVNQTPKQSWGEGAGIYLGKGLVLTAAHVVGITLLTRPRVMIAGHEFPTSTVKRGAFETIDLTLLSFDDSALPMRYRMRRTLICGRDPWPGEQVVTVTPGHIAHSSVISPSLLPAGARKFSTAIGDVRETGNSGSGVFDIQHGCLLGIISRKISRSVADQTLDIAKYFVPAATIASFIPSDYAIGRAPAQYP